MVIPLIYLSFGSIRRLLGLSVLICTYVNMNYTIGNWAETARPASGANEMVADQYYRAQRQNEPWNKKGGGGG